jgi:hypothetical protein
MASSSVTSCKNAISMFKEDYVRILTQKSQILCFRPKTSRRSSVNNIRPDDVEIPSERSSVSRSFEQVKVASVWTSWQHVRTLFRVQEKSSVPVHPFGRRGNTVRGPIRVRQELGFPSQTQLKEDSCIRPDNWGTPSGRYP